MPFLIQTRPVYKEIVATINAPVIDGEPLRIYHALNDKISRRAENEVIHVVMDIAQVSYAYRLPLELFVRIIAKIYEKWYSNRSLVLWFASNQVSLDSVRYLVQTAVVPVYVHKDIEQVYAGIEAMAGETAGFEEVETDN